MWQPDRCGQRRKRSFHVVNSLVLSYDPVETLYTECIAYLSISIVAPFKELIECLNIYHDTYASYHRVEHGHY